MSLPYDGILALEVQRRRQGMDTEYMTGTVITTAWSMRYECIKTNVIWEGAVVERKAWTESGTYHVRR